MEYKEMNEIEQKEFIAKLCHAVRTFPTAFCMAQEIITLAESRHVFDGTQFGRTITDKPL